MTVTSDLCAEGVRPPEKFPSFFFFSFAACLLLCSVLLSHMTTEGGRSKVCLH